jgi:hypothetical protein
MVAVSGSAASRDAPPHTGISSDSLGGPKHRGLGSHKDGFERSVEFSAGDMHDGLANVADTATTCGALFGTRKTPWRTLAAFTGSGRRSR